MKDSEWPSTLAATVIPPQDRGSPLDQLTPKRMPIPRLPLVAEIIVIIILITIPLTFPP